MNELPPSSSSSSSSRSFGRTVIAALVLLVAVYLLFGIVVHLLSFVFSTAIYIIAVVAVIWALRVLL